MVLVLPYVCTLTVLKRDSLATASQVSSVSRKWCPLLRAWLPIIRQLQMSLQKTSERTEASPSSLCYITSISTRDWSFKGCRGWSGLRIESRRYEGGQDHLTTLKCPRIWCTREYSWWLDFYSAIQISSQSLCEDIPSFLLYKLY